jgi:hypothetical protein
MKGEKTMSNNINEPEDRRLMILKGIGQDLKSSEIATQLGVNRWIVSKDLRTMRYNRDPELIKAYKDRAARALANRQSFTKVRDERFHLMTGMTFQEKNFENMISFYRPELMKILSSKKEYVAIMDLSKGVQRTLVHNEIIAGRKYRRRISSKARSFLPNTKQ